MGPYWTAPHWGAQCRSGVYGAGLGHKRLSTHSMGSRVTTLADLGCAAGRGREDRAMEGQRGPKGEGQGAQDRPPLPCPPLPKAFLPSATSLPPLHRPTLAGQGE